MGGDQRHAEGERRVRHSTPNDTHGDLLAHPAFAGFAPYAPEVPGLFLYLPGRAQASPAFRAFVDTARELADEPQPLSAT